MLAYIRRLAGRYLPWDRRLTRSFWGNATEAIFAATLIGVGLVLVTWFVATQVLAGLSGQWAGTLQRSLGIAVSSSLMLLGVFRLLRVFYANTGSQEHRSRFWQQAFDLDYLRPQDSVEQAFPNIPAVELGALGPGSRLRFRLVGLQPSRGRLLGLAAFSFLMLGVCTVLLAVMRDQWTQLSWERIAMTISVQCVLVGVTAWLLMKTGKGLVTQSQVGESSVELSHHPLLPGQDYQVYFHQIGEIRLEKLCLLLECWEQTTFQEGTDVCSQEHTSYSAELAEMTNVELREEGASGIYPLRLPEDAMHSFVAENNRIGWRVVLVGKPQGGREFRREFPFVVRPVSGARVSSG